MQTTRQVYIVRNSKEETWSHQTGFDPSAVHINPTIGSQASFRSDCCCSCSAVPCNIANRPNQQQPPCGNFSMICFGWPHFRTVCCNDQCKGWGGRGFMAGRCWESRSGAAVQVRGLTSRKLQPLPFKYVSPECLSPAAESFAAPARSQDRAAQAVKPRPPLGFLFATLRSPQDFFLQVSGDFGGDLQHFAIVSMALSPGRLARIGIFNRAALPRLTFSQGPLTSGSETGHAEGTRC